MGLIERLRTEARSIDTTTFGNPAPWLLEALGMNKAKSGVTVNPLTARGHTAVYACINVIAQDVAKLPLKMYRRLERGRQLVYDDPRAFLLHDQPNRLMTAFAFHYTLVTHALGWGNAYAEIEWSQDERSILGLWPLQPDRTQPEIRFDAADQPVKLYRTTINEKGGQREVFLPAHRVLHFMGPTLDGIKGRSPITDCREAIGLGLAAQEFGARFFSNGAHMGHVAYHPAAVSDKAEKRIRAGLEELKKGLENAHRIAVLEEGIKLERLGLPQQDAQFIETKNANLADVARIYRMPPHKIQDLDRATNNNIEHQGLEYLTDCLSPWLINFEQTYNLGLFQPAERGTIYVRFNADAILRADSKTRAEVQSVKILSGQLSPNGAREQDELNPLPPEQGDIYILPANYTRSELIGQQFGAPKEKTSAPAGDRTALASACQRVLEAALGRVVRREVKAVGKLARELEELGDVQRAIASAVGELEPVLRSELAVLVEAFGDLVPAGFETSFARSYVDDSREQLLALVAESRQAVLDRLTSWEETKAATLARLALESVTHERS